MFPVLGLTKKQNLQKMTTLKEHVVEQINNMSTGELVQLNNAYCQFANYPDSEIYDNDEEFFNMFFENKVMEAVRAVAFGEYNYTDDFVKFNGYGNLESLNWIGTHDLADSVGTIAEYAIENQRDFDFLDFDFDEEEDDEEGE